MQFYQMRGFSQCNYTGKKKYVFAHILACHFRIQRALDHMSSKCCNALLKIVGYLQGTAIEMAAKK